MLFLPQLFFFASFYFPYFEALVSSCNKLCFIIYEVSLKFVILILYFLAFFVSFVTFLVFVKLCVGKHYNFYESCFVIVTTKAPPNSLMDSTTNPKMKTSEGKGVGRCSLTCSTSWVEGRVGTLGWGLERLTSKSIIHTDVH
jgi:hypothetical protein